MEKISLEIAGSIHNFLVLKDEEDQRLDSFISNKFPSYSRSFFEKLIELGLVKINEKIITKKSFKISVGDSIEIKFPEKRNRETESARQEKVNSLGVEIVFENEHFLIINKPAGLIVHPSEAGSEIINQADEKITLVDWILANVKEISCQGFDQRPGIVHRLDKDTSGLMIIPKNSCSHAIFSQMFKDRKIKKTYIALVHGHPDKTGKIDFAIARDPKQKIKMIHVTSSNVSRIKGTCRQAETDFEVIEYFEDHSLVKAYPLTGRTHQIRVHFCAIKHPLLGDAVYGQKSKIISRHALHAQHLEFEFEGEKISITQNLPKDFEQAINFFRIKKD